MVCSRRGTKPERYNDHTNTGKPLPITIYRYKDTFRSSVDIIEMPSKVRL
jgi:hypothetical protein